jgi:hypothetical protein
MDKMGNYINYCLYEYKRVNGGTKRFTDTRFNLPESLLCCVPIREPKCLVMEFKITVSIRRISAQFSATIFNPKLKAIFTGTVFFYS